jgi:hypothetical protein
VLTSDFIAWLAAQEINGEPMPVIYQGPNGPGAEPREHIVVTPVPGGGMQVDGHIEQRVFQIKTVGTMGLNSRNWNDVFSKTEDLAQRIDKLIMNTWRPVIGGEQVVYMSRFGTRVRQGGPSGQPIDNANRPAFQTMYVVEAESNIYDD